MSAMVPKISESSSPVAPICPVCSAVPLDPTDQFCRRCGCQLKLTCAHCHGKIRQFGLECKLSQQSQNCRCKWNTCTESYLVEAMHWELKCAVNARVRRPFDRYCASCGARRLIIFDQMRQYIYFRSPFFIVGLSVAMAGAWMGLRYILKSRLPAQR